MLPLATFHEVDLDPQHYLYFFLFIYNILFRDILGGGEGRGGGNSRAAAQAAGCRRVTIQVTQNDLTYTPPPLDIPILHV